MKKKVLICSMIVTSLLMLLFYISLISMAKKNRLDTYVKAMIFEYSGIIVLLQVIFLSITIFIPMNKNIKLLFIGAQILLMLCTVLMIDQNNGIFNPL